MCFNKVVNSLDLLQWSEQDNPLYCWLLDKANGINKPDISFGYVHTANPMKTQRFLPCCSAGTVNQCCCHCCGRLVISKMQAKLAF